MSKLKVKPVHLLVLLCLFHLVGNLVWVSLDNRPPDWDAAAHTLFAFRFGRFFKSLSQFSFRGDFLKAAVADPYGPLARAIGGLFVFLFRLQPGEVQFLGTIFFLGNLILIFLLGRQLFQDDWVGFWGAFIFSFYLFVYEYSRWFLLDLPLLFFLLLSIYLLLKSDFFKKEKLTWWAVLVATAVVLVKLQGAAYLVWPFGWGLAVILKRKDKQALKVVAKAGLIGMGLMSVWLLITGKELVQYFNLAVKPEPGVDPFLLNRLETWFYYLGTFLNYGASFLPFLVYLLPGLIFLFKGEKRVFLAGNVALYYLLFTIFPNKDFRYVFPVLPFLSLMIAWGTVWLLKRGGSFRLIWTGLVVLQIFLYLTLSFGFPFRRGMSIRFLLPGFNDIQVWRTVDYPVYLFDRRQWPNQAVIRDLYSLYQQSQNQEGPLRVLLIPNYKHFNDNNLRMEMTNLDYDDKILLDRAYWKLKFAPITEFQEQVASYQYVLYTPGKTGPAYQFDQEVIKQIQADVTRHLWLNKAEVVKKYPLPNNEEVWLVKKNDFLPADNLLNQLVPFCQISVQPGDNDNHRIFQLRWFGVDQGWHKLEFGDGHFVDLLIESKIGQREVDHWFGDLEVNQYQVRWIIKGENGEAASCQQQIGVENPVVGEEGAENL
ncbi:phospholipid carrier-dependent glycosyltransferase [Patescibacteria group bacterium]